MNLGAYDKKDYCVQFRETDFNFVSRLLEQEGIYYFFEHEDGKHTMVLGDSPDGHNPCPHQESARYHQISAGSRLDEDVIVSLLKTQEIRIGKYTVNDYNFETPTADLKVEVDCQIPLGPGEREIYDYPAEYSARTDGDRLANIRMQGEEAKITTITGTSNCKAFTSGYKFNLTGYYRHEMNDASYVLVSISHNATEPAGSSGGESAATYNNNFYCIPFDVPFRPPLVTPKPIGSVQTAVVVGPKGEEIYTDKHGRVKVQFHWDREGKKDENSSCWIRVSQPWAGTGWGAMFIPHIGHEVIVEFVEGDPDRPIITGRVYHGTNMPADKLPEEKTKSVIRSWQDNDIVIEDKDGDKHIHLKQACGNEIIMHEGTPSIDIKQACGNEILMRDGSGIQIRDQAGNEVVLDSAGAFLRLHSPSNDSTIELGKSITESTTSSRSSTIGGDRTSSVQGSSSSIIFGAKEQTIFGPFKAEWKGIQAKLTGGLVSETFIGGKHETLVGAKVTLNAAKEITKNAANRDRQATGPIHYSSAAHINLEAPGSMLWLDGDGADIMAGSSVIKVNKGGPITLTSDSDIKIDSGGDVTIKGGNIKLEGDAKITGELDHPSINAKK